MTNTELSMSTMPSLVSLVLWVGAIYFGGFITGYLVRGWAGPLSDAGLQHVVVLCITLVWAIAFVASITIVEYSIPTWIHVLMGMVAGFLFKGDGEFSIPINIGGSGGKNGGS